MGEAWVPSLSRPVLPSRPICAWRPCTRVPSGSLRARSDPPAIASTVETRIARHTGVGINPALAKAAVAAALPVSAGRLRQGRGQARDGDRVDAKPGL